MLAAGINELQASTSLSGSNVTVSYQGEESFHRPMLQRDLSDMDTNLQDHTGFVAC